MLFEIGIVWVDVDKILNHPVAEVVLLLEEETRGELSPRGGGGLVFLCAQAVPGSTDVRKLPVTDIISFSTYHSLNHVRSLRA